MEKKGARLFQQDAEAFECGWNIVELDSRRQLRLKVNELLRLSHDPTLTTSEMQQHLLHGVATFGKQLATQLCVRFNATTTRNAKPSSGY